MEDTVPLFLVSQAGQPAILQELADECRPVFLILPKQVQEPEGLFPVQGVGQPAFE
jgi:hypothetical protein